MAVAFQPITHLPGKSPGDGGEHLHAYRKSVGKERLWGPPEPGQSVMQPCVSCMSLDVALITGIKWLEDE